ncbi:MAG: Flp pilus assembly protein CpaB [Planctomycetes bacterium]|nr:Flp pilus assembly protein CpaB [Planctomycetota bacterium]
MKPKTLILTVVAVTCGLGASYMTSRLLADRGETQEKVEILVAKKGLDQGMIIKDVDSVFVVKQIPAEMAERDSLRPGDADQLKGRQLKRALRANDPIRQDDFRGDKEVDLEGRISQGFRALGIRVNAESIASGFASLPHSRVDIISTVRRGSDKDSFSQILLENVLVLAADQNTIRTESGQPMPANVVTVALKPEDVVKVTLARELGPLSLVLRKFNDSTKAGDVKVSVEQLMTKTDKVGEDFVDNAGEPSTGKSPVALPTLPKAKETTVAKVEPAPKEIIPAPYMEPQFSHELIITEGDKQRKIQYLLDKDGQVVGGGGDVNRSDPAPPRPQPQLQSPATQPRPNPAPQPEAAPKEDK